MYFQAVIEIFEPKLYDVRHLHSTANHCTQINGSKSNARKIVKQKYITSVY
jgi:hypothetical protein